MSFDAELRDHLGVAAVTAYVGQRIRPGILSDGDGMPAITYSLVSGSPQNSLDGFTSHLVRYSVQIDCWAKTLNAVNSLALVVRDRMNVSASGFKTVITDFPLLDDYENDTRRFRRSLACACWHTEQ